LADWPSPVGSGLVVGDHLRHQQRLAEAVLNLAEACALSWSEGSSQKLDARLIDLAIVGVSPVHGIVAAHAGPGVALPFILLQAVRRASQDGDFVAARRIVVGMADRDLEVDHVVPGLLLDLRPDLRKP